MAKPKGKQLAGVQESSRGLVIVPIFRQFFSCIWSSSRPVVSVLYIHTFLMSSLALNIQFGSEEHLEIWNDSVEVWGMKVSARPNMYDEWRNLLSFSDHIERLRLCRRQAPCGWPERIPHRVSMWVPLCQAARVKIAHQMMQSCLSHNAQYGRDDITISDQRHRRSRMLRLPSGYRGNRISQI